KVPWPGPAIKPKNEAAGFLYCRVDGSRPGRPAKRCGASVHCQTSKGVFARETVLIDVSRDRAHRTSGTDDDAGTAVGHPPPPESSAHGSGRYQVPAVSAGN